MFSKVRDLKRRRHAAAFLCSALMLGLLSAILPVKASAASVPLSMEEMMAIADEVVAVRVTGTKSIPKDGMVYTTAVFEVMDTFKGQMSGTQQMTYMGGKWRSLVMEVPAVPKLTKGEKAVLFLNKPVENYPKAMQEEFAKSASPAAMSYQIVGGRLGKFTIHETESAGDDSPKGVMSRQPVVAREYEDARKVKLDNKPSYDDFAAALRKLAVSQKMASEKGAKTKINGVLGEYAVPERMEIDVLRAFDPLPPIAYLSDEELKQVQQKVKQQIMEKQQAKEAAQEASKNEAGEAKAD